MKIIQITVTAGGRENTCDTLYALTDTGELFLLPDAATVGHEDQTHWRSLPLPYPCKRQDLDN